MHGCGAGCVTFAGLLAFNLGEVSADASMAMVRDAGLLLLFVLDLFLRFCPAACAAACLAAHHLPHHIL